MSDRTSAGIFADVFELLVEEVSVTWRNPMALRLWEMSLQYDFSPQQMEIEETLEALGLAGKDKEGYWVYGPEGDRE